MHRLNSTPGSSSPEHDHHGTYAGRGRAYGRAEIFQGGALVGSFVQDSMIREMPART